MVMFAIGDQQELMIADLPNAQLKLAGRVCRHDRKVAEANMLCREVRMSI
jgi:hypothetical protein